MPQRRLVSVPVVPGGWGGVFVARERLDVAHERVVTVQYVVALALACSVAQVCLSENQLAPMAGMSQQSLNDRMNGKVEWKINEIQRVCGAAGLSFTYITAGADQLPGGGGDDGGAAGAPTRARTWDLRIKSP